MPKSHVPSTRFARDLHIARARRAIEQLIRAVELVEEEFAAELDALTPGLRESGFNLVHYLAARRYDLRPLQDDLARLGLSSLGHMEPHVQTSLRLVRDALAALAGEPAPDADAQRRSISTPARRCCANTPTRCSAPAATPASWSPCRARRPTTPH